MTYSTSRKFEPANANTGTLFKMFPSNRKLLSSGNDFMKLTSTVAIWFPSNCLQVKKKSEMAVH
jgi:hypothetical protein